MYRVFDRNNNLIAESPDRDEAVKSAKETNPTDALVVEYTDEEGRTTAFFVGPAPRAMG